MAEAGAFGPRVGPASSEHRAVCGYSDTPAAPLCEAPASRHVLADSPQYGLVSLAACPDHLEIARLAGRFLDEHQHTGVCGLPGTRWSFDEDACVIDDSGVEPELEGNRGAYA
ncbi:hypothetical protein [Micromonospora chalcea]|uniref:hypothetical protein n=1 Tax=Micromonospora chalcea TaxID=1874 RepID=UPI00379CD8AC